MLGLFNRNGYFETILCSIRIIAWLVQFKLQKYFYGILKITRTVVKNNNIMRHQTARTETLCSSIIFYFKLSLREQYNIVQKSRNPHKKKIQKIYIPCTCHGIFLFGL